MCSHVSRSKDALRKHVSYRHPGAPSPCETEARRKRANKLLASSINASAAAAAAAVAAASSSSGEITPTSPNNPAALHQPFQSGSASMVGDRSCTGDLNQPQLSAAQLNSAYQMFLPNQFHLAAAAANAAAQHHFRENSPNASNNIITTNTSTTTCSTATTSTTPPTKKDFVAPGNMQNSLNTTAPSVGEVNKLNTTNTDANTSNTNSPSHTSDLTANTVFSTLSEPKISSTITNS